MSDTQVAAAPISCNAGAMRSQHPDHNSRTGLRFAVLVAAGALLASSCGFVEIGAPDETTTTVAPTTTLAQTTTSTAAPTTTETPPSTVAPSFADTYAAVSNGVFRVEAILCDGSGSQGTGFLIGDNLLLTAAHVTGDASEVAVSLSLIHI